MNTDMDRYLILLLIYFFICFLKWGGCFIVFLDFGNRLRGLFANLSVSWNVFQGFVSKQSYQPSFSLLAFSFRQTWPCHFVTCWMQRGAIRNRAFFFFSFSKVHKHVSLKRLWWYQSNINNPIIVNRVESCFHTSDRHSNVTCELIANDKDTTELIK